MELVDFEQVKTSFSSGDIDAKVDIYCTTENLTKEQYRELLTMFPVSEIHRLEEALR